MKAEDVFNAMATYGLALRRIMPTSISREGWAVAYTGNKLWNIVDGWKHYYDCTADEAVEKFVAELEEKREHQPSYTIAKCKIVWKDSNDEEDVTISVDGHDNDDIFFVCDSVVNFFKVLGIGSSKDNGQDFRVLRWRFY